MPSKILNFSWRGALSSFNLPSYINDKWEAALVSYSIPNHFNNVTRRNNRFKYLQDGTWHIIEIPPGLYTFHTVVKYIIQTGIQFQQKPCVRGELLIHMNIAEGCMVDFSQANSIGPTLGFEPTKYSTGVHKSLYCEMLNQNIITLKMNTTSTLHSFIMPLANTPCLSGTISSPIYCKLSNIDSMKITLSFVDINNDIINNDNKQTTVLLKFKL